MKLWTLTRTSSDTGKVTTWADLPERSARSMIAYSLTDNLNETRAAASTFATSVRPDVETAFGPFVFLLSGAA